MGYPRRLIGKEMKLLVHNIPADRGAVNFGRPGEGHGDKFSLSPNGLAQAHYLTTLSIVDPQEKFC